MKTCLLGVLLLLCAAASGEPAKVSGLVDTEAKAQEMARMQKAYQDFSGRDGLPMKGVKLALELFPDGSVKSELCADDARMFLRENFIWAKGVVVRQYDEKGGEESRVELEQCVLDRVKRSVWAEGHVKATHGGTYVEGRGCYLSQADGFLRILADVHVFTTDFATKEVVL